MRHLRPPRPTVKGMDDSPAAANVWKHLERLGCERSKTVHVPAQGITTYRVVILRKGTAVATGEHEVLSLASSRALLDALQELSPRRPASALGGRPFASSPLITRIRSA